MPEATQVNFQPPQQQGGGNPFDPKSLMQTIGGAGQMLGLPMPIAAGFQLLGGGDPMQVMASMTGGGGGQVPPGGPPGMAGSPSPGGMMPPGMPDPTGGNPFMGPPPGQVIPGGGPGGMPPGPPPQLMA